MGVRSPRAAAAVKATPLILLGVVVACGRIGFDEMPLDISVDASLDVGSRPPDATAGPLDGAEEPSPDDAMSGFDAPTSDDVSLGDETSPVEAGLEAGPSCSPSCDNAHGTTSCVSGVCVPVCAAGYADCDGDVANGCEANLQADPTHCGTCARVCVVDAGSPLCTAGVCGSSACATGTGDCDGNKANGCETNLQTSTANCSFCGNACTNANGTTSCVAGACKPACSGGFGDCDGNALNGCETAVDTTSNCGTCGHVCTSDAGTPTCSGGTCGTSCNLTGTYAAKISVALSWPSSATLATGSGTLLVWALITGTQSGNSVATTMLPCGITLPDFVSSPLAGNELYGLTFPNPLFDNVPAFLPSVSTTLTLTGTSPGSSFTMPATAFLFGLTMTNPTTDAWPSTPETVMTTLVEDSEPGVTAPYKSGGSYVGVPLNIAKSLRADEAYLASRLATSISGTLSSCTALGGTATVTHFDTHIVGCHVSGGVDCTQTESDFTDSNRPAYVAGAATFNLVKVAANATCAVVRSAL